ncbi:MAG: nucleoside hydrolase [Lachnospiraceae bacterium]|nr:nucleoside hydrolase [Lachnospiraceae bacterium]
MNTYISLNKRLDTKVILETDLCLDVDDVGAIAILCDYVKTLGIKLCGISINVNGPYEAGAADALLSWFDLPPVPICVWDGEIPPCGNESRYLKYLFDSKDENRYASLNVMEPVEFYRQILSDADDQSVEIISIGFFCNLDKAFRHMPDLFARKVRSVVAMAGSFRERVDYPEFNIREMPNEARQFINAYPGELYFIGFETGDRVITDLSDWNPDTANLIYESYRLFTNGSLCRPSWDPVAVDFAVNGTNERYGLSESGKVTVLESSVCDFQPKKSGKHYYVLFHQTHEEIGAFISGQLKEIAHDRQKSPEQE